MTSTLFSLKAALAESRPRLPPHWCVHNFALREVAKVGCISGFQSTGPTFGASLVPHRLPRVAGAAHASVVTVPKMGQHAKYATSSTYTNTTLGPITAFGAMYPGSGYLVVLGKLLRGSFGTKGEHGTVRKVDQNTTASKREIRTPDGVWPHSTIFCWRQNQPTRPKLQFGRVDGPHM